MDRQWHRVTTSWSSNTVIAIRKHTCAAVSASAVVSSATDSRGQLKRGQRWCGSRQRIQKCLFLPFFCSPAGWHSLWQDVRTQGDLGSGQCLRPTRGCTFCSWIINHFWITANIFDLRELLQLISTRHGRKMAVVLSAQKVAVMPKTVQADSSSDKSFHFLMA